MKNFELDLTSDIESISFASKSNYRGANALTIDFEDWYQGLEIPYADWDSFEDRIEFASNELLEVLSESDTKATFFILGYLAEKFPALVKQIQEAGHEIGTHGYSHALIYTQKPEVFSEEMNRAIGVCENLAQTKVRGHRAPFFSITRDSLWALDILSEHGIEYDSSIFPVLNYRYGIAGTPRFPYRLKNLSRAEIFEFPVSTYEVLNTTIPVSGGAYFRIYPYKLTKLFLKKINNQGMPFTFYLHPWELDPEHPRIDLPRRIAATHYFNLRACKRRFKKLLKDFKFAPMRNVIQEMEFSKI